MHLHRLVVCICAALLSFGAQAAPLAAKRFPAAKRPPSELQFLYVMDYDIMFDWEPVLLEKGVTDGLVAWLTKLRDRLTVTVEKPLGEQLKIPSQWWIPDVARTSELQDTSLAYIIWKQLEADSPTILLPKYLLVVYQMSMVPGGPSPEDLFVTNAKTFWQVVEASAAADNFVTRSQFDVSELQVLDNFIVTLPSHAPGVEHGQDSWRGESISDKYGDHAAWDVHVIVEMLQKFFAVSGAVSLPDLDEYEWRQDKTIIHDVLQTHYHKVARGHFPPIPTIAVNIPIDYPTQHLLCYSARYWPEPAAISPEDIRATAASLLHAVKQMEPDKDAQSIQQANQGTGGRPLRQYFIKRNYSACAKHILTFTLRSSSTWRFRTPVAENAPSGQSMHSAQLSDAQHSMLDTAAITTLCSNAHNSSASAAQELVRALIGAETNTRSMTANGTTADTEFANLELDDAMHDAQELLRVAEHIARQACGETWLLQPFVPGMMANEYRVYLIGGAEATGNSNDTALVYTPVYYADYDGERRMVIWNATLPLHFFSRAPSNLQAEYSLWAYQDHEMNSPLSDEYYVSYFPFPIWRDAAMHDLIVRAALSAADAVAQSGRSMRMGQHVLVRSDVVLTRLNGLDKVFINEAQVFNDAGLSFDVWAPPNHNAASKASSTPPATNRSAESQQSSNDTDQVAQEGVCLADIDTDIAAATRLATSGKSKCTDTATADSNRGDEGIRPGYLLAVQLWKEAVATASAVHGVAAHAEA